MKKKLSDVRFFHAIRVDRQENFFKEDMYELELEEVGTTHFIHVTHKPSGKTGSTHLGNVIDFHFAKEVETIKVESQSGTVLRKRTVKKEEPVSVFGV